MEGRRTVVWLYLALQDAASLLDGAQLRHRRILLARPVPLHWALCCSHGEQQQEWTFISPVKTGGTASLDDILSVLNVRYPEGPDMKLDSAAPPRGGLDQEWWGARTSKLFSGQCGPPPLTYHMVRGLLHHRWCWWREVQEFGECSVIKEEGKQ